MITQQLLDYIRQQSQQGISKENIKNQLLASGWQDPVIEEAFNSIVPSSQSDQLHVVPENIASQPSSVPPKRLNKMIVAIISAVSVLTIGGGAFAYFSYIQLPERTIQKMIANLIEVKSLTYSGEIKMQIGTKYLTDSTGGFLQPTPNKKTGDFLISFNGVSDTYDLNNPKGSFSFNINTDALTGLASSFGLEIRVVDGIYYIKTNNLPDLKLLDLSIFKQQWIKIEGRALGEQPALNTYETQLSSEQIIKIKEAVQKSRILRITKRLPEENIDGVNTYHYKFTTDKEKFIKLIAEINIIIEGKTLTEKELSDIGKSFELIEFPEGEIWIGKKDFFPRKILINSVLEETGESFIMTLFLKNFNQAVRIDVPYPVKTLDEIMSEMLTQKPRPN